MRARWYVFLFLSALLIAAGAASFETAPGYMDADYYYAGGKLLASGKGASEPYLWNYLNDPAGLPVPAFGYWMPLTSLLAAAGIRLMPGLGFWGARLALILLTALIPPITALLGWRLYARSSVARLAGVLALFPGFYLAYLTTTDVFALEMVLGGAFFLLLFEAGPDRPFASLRFLGLGILAGLLHLARADGILWLGAGLAAALIIFWRQGRADWPRLLLWLAVVSAGYLLVMAPWFGRNLGEWGQLFPPGGSRALWISEYEQTMIFPATLITPQAWLAAGWETHLRARLNALSVVSGTVVAVQGGVLLFPFMLAGLWQLRRRVEIWLGAGLWLLMILVMVLVFPFAGVNGSYFHSAAGLQVLLWAAAPLGLEKLIEKYAHWRRAAQPMRLVRFMEVIAVATGILLTGAQFFQRVAVSNPVELGWGASDRHYRAVEVELVRLGAQTGDPVLVNNPPGYWLASQRPAAVIPFGGPDMLLAAAQQYGIRFLVLEPTNPLQLSDLYHQRSPRVELEYLASVGATRLYRIQLGE